MFLKSVSFDTCSSIEGQVSNSCFEGCQEMLHNRHWNRIL